jgi:hypothetical protein
MDSGDKATNKAMSAAYKYAAMQAFCIPTEGDNDADAQTHEVKAKEPDQAAIKSLSAAATKGTAAFREAWMALTKAQRESVPQSTVADLKAKCDEADSVTA